MNRNNKPPVGWKKFPLDVKEAIIKSEIDNRVATAILSKGNPDPNDAEALMANLFNAAVNVKKSEALIKKIEAEVRKEFK